MSANRLHGWVPSPRTFYTGVNRLFCTVISRAVVQPTEQPSPKFPGCVPFSMDIGSGIIGVASPEGRHRCPCDSQPTIEEGTRPVRMVWRGDLREAHHLFPSRELRSSFQPL